VGEQPDKYGEPVQQKARRVQELPALHASEEHEPQTGADGGIGKRVISEATRKGEAVVLADHSTEDRASGREGGEVRPKRPTGGKVKPGITYCRGEK